ncbi:MAG: DUF362 domain-containing protein [Candidatus Aenigmatarchaeota archaeon]|nr:MAG: DUF362 domain-containing protein [Candidatus Aenigmarchaeota archaeon]
MLYKNIGEIPINLKGRVAIKLHMGDRGNKTHISPKDVSVLIEKIRAKGGDPYLVDTITLYPRERSTREGYLMVARENGFGDFPIVIARDDVFVEKDGFRIPKDIADADSLIVLSHATGHVLMGFAGAIKNLSIGCVNKYSKRRIHEPMRPLYDEGLCKKCGVCAEACKYGYIKLNDKVEINLKDCHGCRRCVRSCPTGAIHIGKKALENNFELFSESAKAVLSLFKPENVIYINVLKNITELCDCVKDSGDIVCRDMGYLTGKNPLKLDMETPELIRKQNPDTLDFKTWNLFVNIAKKHL